MALPVASTPAPAPAAGVNGGFKAFASGLSDGAWGRNYASIRPKSKPLIMTLGAGGVPALASAGAAQIDLLTFADNPIVWEMYQNTAQTLLPRLVSGSESSGLEVGGDLVDNETVEYVIGGNHAANPYGYTVGTSKPVSFRVSLQITDVSGNDQLVIGWRKQQAYAAAANPIFLSGSDPTYTDFAAIGFAAAAANPNVVRTITDLNDSGTPVVSNTLFTWADGLRHTLEVRIYGRRVVYFINGIRVGNPIAKDGAGGSITSQSTTTPAAYTCDVGDFLVPFIFIRYDATAPGTIFVSPSCILPGIEVGPLSEMGLDPSNLQL